ncbi:MAG: hypothetical protein JJU35_14405 [Balneolales bacterium]|nr:hypothetical protein [Balneolales bacterium]
MIFASRGNVPISIQHNRADQPAAFLQLFTRQLILFFASFDDSICQNHHALAPFFPEINRYLVGYWFRQPSAMPDSD